MNDVAFLREAAMKREGVISNSLSEEDREKARKSLLKSHFYKVMALGTLLFGVVMFVLLYIEYINGNPGVILQRPVILFIIFSPFIPAAVFMLLSKKARQHTGRIVNKNQ